MEVQATIDNGLKARWTFLDNKKSTLYRQCEQYAAWTLPYMFPPENLSENFELPIGTDSIGAQGTNHLSNKITSTLFPNKSLFFRLHLDQEMKDMIAAAQSQEGMSIDDAKAQLEAAVLEAEDFMQAAEARAEDHLDMVRYRPQAIQAVKLLIITGNALVFHPEDNGPVKVYNLRNYHVVRDCDGQEVEIMTREKKAFETFRPDIKDKLQSNWRTEQMYSKDHRKESRKNAQYNDSTEVTIYTQVRLEDDGKWHLTQYADEVRLDTTAVYTADKLRWIPLVWNLVDGEDYGRGLVGDFAGAFSALGVLNSSLLNLSAIMGDVKFLVNPQSMVDVVELQNSLPGSYHVGNPEDVGTPQLNKMSEAQFIQGMIERYERQISQAFMLMSGTTRQAERVTAEEIRRDVDELETSNGGIYSRLAATWQIRTAYIALNDTGFEGIGDGIEPRVITGMDSLSRAGEAYNMRLFLSDLGMLQAVPEDLRAAVKKPQFMQQIAQYHQVPYEAWVMTPAELQAEQDRLMQQQMQLQQQQIDGQAQTETIKAAAKE